MMPAQVADAVAVGVGEAARVDLVDDGGLPPGVRGHGGEVLVSRPRAAADAATTRASASGSVGRARPRSLVHADRRGAPDRMRIAGPTDRISSPRRPRWSTARPTLGHAAGAAVGDVVAARWRPPCPRSGPASASTCCWSRNSEATVWLDGEPVQGLVSGPEHQPPGRAADAARGRAASRSRARWRSPATACSAGRSSTAAPHEPRPPHRGRSRSSAASWRASTPTRGSSPQDLRVLVGADGRARRRPAWRGELLRELNRFCNAGRRTTGRRGRGARVARARCSPGATARARTRSRRSGTRTSTPRGCGRSRRPTASACARSRPSSR